MEINEIKKKIYLQKPTANLLYIRKGFVYYDTTIKINDDTIIIVKTIFFKVPVSDMGDADFLPKMQSSLLIRWINPLDENI